MFYIKRRVPKGRHKIFLAEKKILYPMSLVATANHHQPTYELILFSKILEFFTEIYGFFPNFFAHNNQQKALHHYQFITSFYHYQF